MRSVGGSEAGIEKELTQVASLPGSLELKAEGCQSDELSDPVGGIGELDREILSL
jgi:hypothetical protein